MMKKSFLFTTAASMLWLASCSQDDFAPVQDNNENGNVTFTVSLNDKPATRAFGDGLSATNLNFAAYDVTDDNSAVLASVGSATFNNTLSTTVSLNLVTGRDYKVVFFASNKANETYSFNAEKKNVTVDYSKMSLNGNQTVDNDCFYNTLEVSSNDLGKSLSVTLNRPVAQINFGTADIDNTAVDVVYGENAENLHASLTTKGYTTLDLINGEVSGDAVDITTPVVAKPSASENPFPVTGDYNYILCSYVLVPNTTTVEDVTLHLYKDATTEHTTLSVSNVPLQANYRTNIYGNLLTTKTDVTVSKDKEWSNSYDVKLWDGSIEEVPKADEKGVIELSTPAQFAGLAKKVNEGISYKGVTIKLANDIDLNNINWTPIGLGGETDTEVESKPFEGNFDGQGKTISNLSIILTTQAVHAGFFGKTLNSNLTNVKLENVYIDVRNATGTPTNVGGFIGTPYTSNVSEVSVKNVVIKSYRRSGGVVGQIYGSITNCEAENVTIDMILDSSNDNGDKGGGIAGQCNEGKYFHTNNKAKNVKITGFRHLGGIFGMVNYNSTLSNNYSEDVIIKVIEGATTDKENNTPVGFGAIFGQGRTPLTIGENNIFNNYTFIDKDGKESENQSGSLPPTAQ